MRLVVGRHRRRAGAPSPDGIYRIRLNLRRQGRAVLIPRNIDKDTTPPKIASPSIGPERQVPRPELLPRADGEPAEVHFQAPGRPARRSLVFRTDVRPARAVFDAPVKLADDATSWTWDGTVRRAPRRAPGPTLVVVRARDQRRQHRHLGRRSRRASSTAARCPAAAASRSATCAPSRRPSPIEGARDRGRRRRLGRRALHLAAAPHRRRPGSATAAAAAARAIVRFAAPGGKSGLYLFEVRTRTRRTAAPVVVTGAPGARRARRPAADDLAGPQPRRRRRRRAPRHALGRPARAARAPVRRATASRPRSAATRRCCSPSSTARAAATTSRPTSRWRAARDRSSASTAA